MGDVLIKFRYEERDVASALRLRLATSLRKRPEMLLALVVVTVGCAVSWVLAPALARVLVGGLAASVVLLVISTLVLAPRAMFRRRAHLHLPMTVDASDDGLTIVRGGHAATVAWSECARVETNARVCLIHYGDEFLIVPRRVFRNASREKAFLELVSTRAARSDDSTPENPRP